MGLVRVGVRVQVRSKGVVVGLRVRVWGGESWG